jgi:hypothetical protein
MILVLIFRIFAIEYQLKLGPTRYSPIRMAAEQEVMTDFISEQKFKIFVEKINNIGLTIAFCFVGSFHPSIVSIVHITHFS